MIENDLTTEDFESEKTETEPTPVSSAEFIKYSSDEVLLEIPAPQFLAIESPVEKLELDPGVLEASDSDASGEEETDPIFAELALPKLPQLARENRARLQMQTPNRVFFYWSIKSNPFQVLQKVFAGNTGNYQLVAKFVNLKTGREEFRPVDAEGEYWFNVDSDASYRAEVGFYAPNRPYIRVVFSNSIETPRKSPSPRTATNADWAISAKAFAKVLDNSGFRQDAVEVKMVGDDIRKTEYATQLAFHDLVGGDGKVDLTAINSDEVRFALLALASGVTLEDLRGQISETLFLVLQKHSASVSADSALTALKEHFEVFDEEIFEEETIGAAVFGASLVHFPKSIRTRTVPKAGLPKDDEADAPRFLPKLSPLSSLSFSGR